MSFQKKILFLCVLILCCVIILEFFLRISFFLKYKKTFFLTMPIWGSFDENAPYIPVDYRQKTEWIKNNNGEILYYKFSPGTYIHENEYDNRKRTISYTINSKGFRTPEFLYTKKKYRIITFGGSSTQGLESPDQQTWPAYLEQYLSPHRVEIINMGASRYQIKNIYYLLSMEAIKYQPDVIIIYSGYNDIHLNHGKLRLDRWYKNIIFPLHTLFYPSWLTYRYLIEKASLAVQGHTDAFLFYPYDPFSSYIEFLKKIASFCRLNNIHLVYVHQVENINKDPGLSLKLTEEAIERSKLHKKLRSFSMHLTAHLYKLQRLSSIVLKDSSHVTFIDPRRTFYKAMLEDRRQYFGFI